MGKYLTVLTCRQEGGSVLLSDLKHEGWGFVFSTYSMQTPCEQSRAGLSPPEEGERKPLKRQCYN